ncbi:MAG: MFS transporter [Chloroflexi bacterium]|nr:MFS transporter [Chloroflexota bacterium]
MDNYLNKYAGRHMDAGGSEIGGGGFRGRGAMQGGRPAFSLRNLRTFNSFKNSVFRLYYGGMLGQMAAMNMQMIAGSLLLKRLTDSPAFLGAMSFANAIPMITLSFFGGVIADRVEKKFVLLAGQIAFALVSLAIALALTFDYLNREHVWILVVSSIIQGAVMGLAMPSRQAIINDIVEEEELMNAISLNFMGMNALQILAPAIAGFMVAKYDFEAAYYTMTGLYIMAIIFFIFMPRIGVKESGRGNALENIKEGLHYVWHEETIRTVLILSFIAVVLSMPYGMLMPFFADDVLNVGAQGMGIMFSVSGAGAIVASITLASLPNKKRGIMLLIGGIILGLALTGFAFSTLWPLSLTLIVFVGIGGTVRMSLTNTLVQYYVEDEYRGRVMSLFMMQFGLSSFGTFAAGLIAESFGVQWGIGGFAIALIVLSILTLVFLPKIRKLD